MTLAEFSSGLKAAGSLAIKTQVRECDHFLVFLLLHCRAHMKQSVRVVSLDSATCISGYTPKPPRTCTPTHLESCSCRESRLLRRVESWFSDLTHSMHSRCTVCLNFGPKQSWLSLINRLGRSSGEPRFTQRISGVVLILLELTIRHEVLQTLTHDKWLWVGSGSEGAVPL